MAAGPPAFKGPGRTELELRLNDANRHSLPKNSVTCLPFQSGIPRHSQPMLRGESVQRVAGPSHVYALPALF